MPEFSLKAEPFLGGFSRDIDGTVLTEVTDQSLVSIAQPLDGRVALENAVKTAWGCSLPAPGKSAAGTDGQLRLICMGPDAFMVMMPANGPLAVPDVNRALGTAGYYTEQSDNWVILGFAGPLAIAALERICPIDLHPNVLPAGSFARTSMEHLGAIVMRESDDQFLLLSPSSSARSFLHALETSIEYVS
ncbi:MAG: sarcosine oxidase subunit gamma [Paracoccaceae bacterium]